jgi:NAD+ diphosphatase
MQFDLIVEQPANLPTQAHWVVVRKGHVVVEAGAETLPFGDAPPVDDHLNKHFLGVLDGHAVWAIDIDDHVEPHDWHELVHLRGLYGRVPEQQWVAAGRAEQIVQWDRTHQFCGRCGTATHHHAKDRARECLNCGLLAYPRLSPAVIVLVEKDESILLAHGTQFPQRFFSTLAGFVEAGESLEDTVHREIREEVGIEVSDVSYFNSQPWPFPNSLMLGFTAKWVSGDLVIQEDEIVEAGWFTADDLPPCPIGGMSIAGWLVKDWLTRNSR